ncbi:DUF2938 family protein [Carnimonas nigrificans]|uniref:DUF2938 family protein n=1 Tax=Carnimonas nigrificans TaxID=64323 RepID=UPI00047040A2|nr:DUF2938 family protein [Carnimonas nigrificans]
MLIVLAYSLVVGCIATLLLDAWALLLQAAGMGGSNWGAVGQWVKGLGKGEFFHPGSAAPAVSQQDKAVGWLFHYVVGIIYALLLVVIGGTHFIEAPTWAPIIWVGFVLSTLCGLLILVPALGGGLLASKTPNQAKSIGLMLAGHAVFSIGLYLGAQLFAA